MLTPLNRRAVAAPARPIKIVQFGEGNFLRAFVDWMIDIMNERANFNGNVVIVQPIRQGMADAVNRQDGLYHVVLNGLQQGTPVSEDRLVRCVQRAIDPYTNFEEYLALAEIPELQFVFSNTTEAGIAFNNNDTRFDILPDSFPAKVTQFLHRRWSTFNGASDKGLAVIPCELIDKNGSQLQSTVERYADLWQLPTGFKNWVSEHVHFCNTLVDRIVPGFPKETVANIQERIGFDDQLVVMAEPFHLWVIEAPPSVQAKLPFEEAGLKVKFVPDITPYRTRKVRILNGAHTALVPVAYLKGFRTVRESVNDPQIGRWLAEALAEEIIPTLDLPKDELEQFAGEVIERFSNPFIKHELASIALNSISKYKVRVLPSVLAYIDTRKQLPKRLLHALAALIRFYQGEWKGERLPVNDTPDVIAFFQEVWKGPREEVATRVLANVSFWGLDLNTLPGLTSYVKGELAALDAAVSA